MSLSLPQRSKSTPKTLSDPAALFRPPGPQNLKRTLRNLFVSISQRTTILSNRGKIFSKKTAKKFARVLENCYLCRTSFKVMALGSLTVPLLVAARSGIFILHLFKERTRHKKRLTCNGSFTSLITPTKVRLFSHSSKYLGDFLLKNSQVFRKLYKSIRIKIQNVSAHQFLHKNGKMCNFALSNVSCVKTKGENVF